MKQWQRTLGLLLAAALVTWAMPAFAIEPVLMRESDGLGAPAGATPPCPLPPNLNGTCANYRWYNLCSNYIWIFHIFIAGEGVGVTFGGPSQPCVAPGNRVKRVIHYFRNIVPNYGQTVDLFLDADCDNDGCPEENLGASYNFDPGLRWNCVDYGICIPCGGVVGRQLTDGGVSPTMVTDGPFKSSCDPFHAPTHSYYYGVNGKTCQPWIVIPATDPDDFIMWLIVDGDASCVTVTQPTSWGAIKGLYQ